MPVDEQVEVEPLSDTPPEDFDDYQVWREAGGGSTPAQLPKDSTPPIGAHESEAAPPEEIQEGESAVDPAPAEDEGQEEVEEAIDPLAEPEVPAPGTPGRGTEKRFKKLTGEIAALKSRLEELTQPEIEEEAEVEVASTPEPAPAVAAAPPAPRPKLSNFEDSETAGTAWDQYEAAMDAYNAAKIEAAVEGVRAEAAKEKETLQQQHIQNLHAVAWSEAASRYPDFNSVVVNDAVKISPVMEAVMRMDPKAGTDVAYWLGQHPEESLRIANLTISSGPKGYTPEEYTTKMARAAMEIGKIQAKIDSAAPKGPVAVAPKAAAAAAPGTPVAKTSSLTPGVTPGGLPNPAPKPPIKKVSTASRPPTQIRAAAVAPRFDVTDPATASDYDKWEAQRNRELAARGLR